VLELVSLEIKFLLLFYRMDVVELKLSGVSEMEFSCEENSAAYLERVVGQNVYLKFNRSILLHLCEGFIYSI